MLFDEIITTEYLAPSMKGMTALTRLYLGNNNVTSIGVSTIQEAWQKAGKSGGLYI